MKRSPPDADTPPDQASLVPWPMQRIARHIQNANMSPDALLIVAEAMEAAAAHADSGAPGTTPCAQGLRDLAAGIRDRVPTRNDNPPCEETFG